MAKKVASKPKKTAAVATKKTPAKKPAAKKVVAKKTVAKKTSAKKTPVKKASAKASPAKKTLVKKTSAKGLKKAMPKKTAMKPNKLKASAKRKKVSAIPKGYSNVTPYLMVSNAAQAIEFYKKVYAAKEGFRMEHEGRITHAELKIGNAKIMLADEMDKNASGEKAMGTTVGFHLYTKDCDATIDAAVNAGAKLIQPAENKFYGDRAGMVQDPFGHSWHIATHIEDVSMAMQKKRAQEAYGKK